MPKDLQELEELVDFSALVQTCPNCEEYSLEMNEEQTAHICKNCLYSIAE